MSDLLREEPLILTHDTF